MARALLGAGGGGGSGHALEPSYVSTIKSGEHALEPSNMSTTKSGRAAVKTLKLESRVVERGMHWSTHTFQQELKTLKLESGVVERRAVEGEGSTEFRWGGGVRHALEPSYSARGLGRHRSPQTLSSIGTTKSERRQ